MDFLENSNGITLLSEHVAAHPNMKLHDPRATNWPRVINGALFIDRAYSWAKRLLIADGGFLNMSAAI